MTAGSGTADSALRRNNFDAIRLVAALAVVIGHAWPLTGQSSSPTVLGIPMFTLAVYVFFAVSGYLIATSWASDPNPGRFLARRALRIFPALGIVVIVTFALLGPVFSTLAPAQYFADPQSWGYLINVTLVAQYELPGVFETHPRPVVNGVLWTLGPEFLCYLGVLAVGMLPRRSRPVVVLVLGVVLLLLQGTDLVPDWTAAFRSAVFFVAGASLAAITRRTRLPGWLAVPLGAGWIVGWLIFPALALPLAWIALPPVAVIIGRSRTPVVRDLGRAGDLSYGSYLWGFLVQQALLALAGPLPLAVDIAIVVVVTLLIAFASWHLVEVRALRAKPPRRDQSISPSRSSRS